MADNKLLLTVARLAAEVDQLRKEIRYGTQIYPQKAIVHSVADPENLGRVKVIYPDTHEGVVSEWIYTLGFSSGRVPEQFIGTSGIAIFMDGHQEDAIFIGVIGDQPETAAIRGNPISIPVIDTRANTSIPPCNSASEGQMLLFTNTISVDLKICIRRNTTDTYTDPESDASAEMLEPLYAWKSLTHSLELGVGTYGKSNSSGGNNEYGDTRTNKAWGPCSAALEGERRLFSEDRSLPQAEYICRKQPGSKFVWMPISSAPLYTLNTLPTCSEEFIGAVVMIDDGMNSELVTCARYQAKNVLKWVKFKRDPVKIAVKPEITTQDIQKNPETVTAPEVSTGDIVKSALNQIGFSSDLTELGVPGIVNSILGAIVDAI